MPDSWVSWRAGRAGFKRWHLRTGMRQTKCGIQIPMGADPCYAADEFVKQEPDAEVCVNCLRLRLAERIP